jgi:transposase-like protein
MIRDGISGAEVARRLGVNRYTVSRWRKAAGLSGVTGNRSTEQENDVIDLLRDGKSQAEIGRITGVSDTTIRKWKKRAEKEEFL